MVSIREALALCDEFDWCRKRKLCLEPKKVDLLVKVFRALAAEREELRQCLDWFDTFTGADPFIVDSIAARHGVTE